MKIIKNLKFDIKHGIFGNKALFICPMLIALITFADFALKVNQYHGMKLIDRNNVTYGDYWMYLYGGMKEYIPSPDNPFQFPVLWMVTILTLFFILLNYPYKDMLTVGQQVIVKSKGRKLWWNSKCLWNILGVLTYHVILICSSMLFALFLKFPLSNKINTELISYLFTIDTMTFQPTKPEIPLIVALLPIFLLIAINLLQMTISLFVKPTVSFLFIMILLLSSSYLLVPYMIGNYGMILR